MDCAQVFEFNMRCHLHKGVYGLLQRPVLNTTRFAGGSLFSFAFFLPVDSWIIDTGGSDPAGCCELIFRSSPVYMFLSGNFQEIENTVVMKKWQPGAQKDSALWAVPVRELHKRYVWQCAIKLRESNGSHERQPSNNPLHGTAGSGP